MYKIDRFFNDIKGKKVAFCGIGRSNIPLIKMFYNKGIKKIIACDAKSKDDLVNELNDLEGFNIEFNLGKNYLELSDADIIFRTPGLNFNNEYLKRYRSEGRIVTSEMELFFDLCPCRTIAITGSDGKTTTTSIIYNMLKKQGENVFLGGNLGMPLLNRIEEIQENDFAVVELSSFQLISMRKSPDISVITNIAPNHLDVHKSMDEYISAKKNIFLHQGAFDKTVINIDNEIVKGFADETRARVFSFSMDEREINNGAYLDKNNDIYLCTDGKPHFVMNADEIKIIGRHNIENYLSAICAVSDYVSIENMREIAREFNGVEHRIEFVKEIEGVKYYNDAIATSPTRAIKGTLSLYDRKIIMIAGGYDKQIPFEDLGPVICDKVKLLILMGDTAEKIENSVRNSKNYNKDDINIIKVSNMKEAIDVSRKYSKPGDIVSLCPACASFGLYKDFVEKGNDFKQIVNNL